MKMWGRHGPPAGSVAVAGDDGRVRTSPRLLMHGSGPGVAGVLVVLGLILLVAPSRDDRVTLRPGGSDSIQMVAASGAMFDRAVLAPGRVQVACTPVAMRAEPGRYMFALQAVSVSGPLARELYLDVDRVPAGAPCRSGAGVGVFRGSLAELTDAATQAWSADDGDQLLRFRVRVGERAEQGQQAAAAFRFTLSALVTDPGDEPDDEPGDERADDPPTPDPPVTVPGATPVVPQPTPARTPTTEQRADQPDRPDRADDPTLAAGPPGSPPSFTDGTRDRTQDRTASEAAGRGWPRVLDTLVEAAPVIVWPALAAAGLALFVLAQRQIDRGDPKLALAPLYDADLVVPLTAGDTVTVERWCRTASITGAAT